MIGLVEGFQMKIYCHPLDLLKIIVSIRSIGNLLEDLSLEKSGGVVSDKYGSLICF